MEEITRILEENKTALNRVMKVNLDQAKSTVDIGSESMLKKILVISLWILLGIDLIFIIAALLIDKVHTPVSWFLFLELFFIVAFFISIILIRKLTFRKHIDIANAKFEFSGQLRKNRTFTLAEYDGAETLRTIKDFPEEFVVRFKTNKGFIQYKLADLNLGYACDIEPNYTAVTALWNAIIKRMQSNDNDTDIKEKNS